MKIEDTEMIRRYSVKPSKMKAWCSQPTCNKCS